MNIDRNIKIGIIGAGRVAQHYKKLINSGEIKSFEIVGVCDISKEKREDLAYNWGCRNFEDLSEMINEVKPDLVLILTPSGFHYEHAKMALKLGCHVLVEKPITLLPFEARELIEIAQLNRLMLGVAFQNRLNPAVRCLKNAIDNGRFGKITTATVRLRWCRYQNYYDDGWHGTWAQDGGVINQQAIHHVDALNWLIGPVESVCAVKTKILNSLEAEDTLVAIIRFCNGALGTIEATTAARPIDIEASLSVVGEGGIASVGGIALNKVEDWIFVNELKDDKSVKEKFSPEVPNGYGLSHVSLLNETLKNLSQGSIIPPVPAADCIKTCELIHALYASTESNSWINLRDKPISNYLGCKK